MAAGLKSTNMAMIPARNEPTWFIDQLCIVESFLPPGSVLSVRLGSRLCENAFWCGLRGVLAESIGSLEFFGATA